MSVLFEMKLSRDYNKIAALFGIFLSICIIYGTRILILFPMGLTSPPNGVYPNGGWWLDPKRPHLGYKLDPGLCKALDTMFDNKDVLDLGAGIGHFGRCFMRLIAPMYPTSPEADEYIIKSFKNESTWWITTPQKVKSWAGFDGAPGIENITNSTVKYLDLTIQQNLRRKYDWVTSFEVGEHIPKEYEAIYIQNLVQHAEEGIVLSWAIRGQNGRMHVNNLNNDEVIQKMVKQGFEPRPDIWLALRNASTVHYFRKTLMVFTPK